MPTDSTPEPPTLADVVAVLDELYDPRWAEDWDAVGLALGDPAQPVRRVLLAVDPADEVVDEALAWGADLLLTHHPLFLRGVHGIAATTAKGARAHRLVRAGTALFTAHTNADSADPGVSDALAAALGLVGTRPLTPRPADPVDKLVVFVPDADADRVLDALAAAGAGAMGAYRRCAWTTTGTGTFRPEPGASPAIGTLGMGAVGQVEQVAETRLETVLPRARRADVVAALRAAHPYEEPAFDVLELASQPGRLGLGRVGELPSPETFGAFCARVAAALPVGPAGVRAAGNTDRTVRRVAVVGGAGDTELAAAQRAGVDVLVTADLRHHPAVEALEQPGSPALVDPGHWASEWPWLPDAAARLVAGLAARGTTVETRVSTLVTDPWTTHVRGA
ncbi:MAG TPA: Nif3-like dinuclear metal center hexameric protein [Motilibacteraceae bacterium]|nr:Nif3-like dinuclear metal center hexameric protein [Motilibacteraceae bacterium]